MPTHVGVVKVRATQPFKKICKTVVKVKEQSLRKSMRVLLKTCVAAEAARMTEEEKAHEKNPPVYQTLVSEIPKAHWKDSSIKLKNAADGAALTQFMMNAEYKKLPDRRLGTLAGV